MTENHPIIPLPELVKQWRSEPEYSDGHHKITMVTMSQDRLMEICEKSALHGADCELDACCEWLKKNTDYHMTIEFFRAARRPKPPSLKEQALEALRHAPGPDYPNPITLLTADEHALIRRALEQLND
jgi:hypothetical protein